MNFSKNIKCDPILSYTSGTADRTSDIIDMKSFDSVAIVVHFAAIAAGATTSLKLYGSTDSGMASPVQLTDFNTTVADDDDNQIFVLDCTRPGFRYLRLTVDKDATNATAESAVAYQYDAQSLPVTHPSDCTVTFAHGAGA